MANRFLKLPARILTPVRYIHAERRHIFPNLASKRAPGPQPDAKYKTPLNQFTQMCYPRDGSEEETSAATNSRQIIATKSQTRNIFLLPLRLRIGTAAFNTLMSLVLFP